MLSDELPTAPPVEVGRYPRLREARERGLVMAAMGLAYWIMKAEREFILQVEEAAREAALAALAEFEAEQRSRPAPQPVAPLRIPWLAVWGTLITQAVFFYLQNTSPPAAVELGAADSRAVVAGEWWRAFTALTLHGGADHLVANLVTGSVFLALVFARFGGGMGALAVVLSGALGNALNAWGYRAVAHVSIGASTAVFGAMGVLVGAELVARLTHRATRSWRQIMGVIGFGVALLAWWGGGGTGKDGQPEAIQRVDVLAHLWGMVAGVGIGAAWESLRTRLRTGALFNRAAGLAAMGLLLLAWKLALRGLA
jgi:membrane associated rhomboid family serine protease